MKSGRNEPCPCGSGRKYKKCCEINMLACEPADTGQLLAEARQEHLAGRLERAEKLCLEILNADPRQAEALHTLGVIAAQRGHNEKCAALMQQALALNPSHVLAHANLAVALHATGQDEAAIEHIKSALELQPESLHAIRSGAALLIDLKRLPEAIPYLQRWAAIEPNNPDVYRMLGDCYQRQGFRQEAIGPYAKALELEPASIDVANNLGACLADGGRRREALALLLKAVELRPDSPAAWANLGVTSKNLGDLDTALECFNRALSLEPGHVNALWNRSLCLLGKGRLADGWPDYEWRWKASEFCRERPFTQPRWDGSNPAGKTILVWMEQGLGDRIQFASMLPDLLRAGARCIVECEARLWTLFQRSFPTAEVVPLTDPPHPRTQQPDIDFQMPAGSLARWFRPALESFPKHRGYLAPDPSRAGEWKKRLDALGEGLKVGICWRSGVNHGMRSMHYSRLAQWGPVLTTPGVHFVNLQYDQCNEELCQAERQFGTRIHRWNDIDLKNDQEGVAALISRLDLVISAGTAVDQMAGALGAPTWVLIRGCGECWGLGTDHCPWYPSVRVFYSGASDPWDPTIGRMASEFGQLVNEVSCGVLQKI